VIKPKKIDDPDDTLTSEEERIVEKGFDQLRRGKFISLDKLRNELDYLKINLRKDIA
jgi:hypothetical protein